MFKAAIKLIAKHGPESMTLAQVGKSAGFTGGLVSYRFGSKIGLLKAVSERILDLWMSRVVRQSLANMTGIQELEKLTELYFNSIRGKSPLMLALFRLMNESYSSYRELAPYFQQFDKDVRRDISKIVEDSKKVGEVSKSIDSEAFAVAYIGVLRGVAMQYFINNSAIDLEATAKIADRFVESIRA